MTAGPGGPLWSLWEEGTALDALRLARRTGTLRAAVAHVADEQRHGRSPSARSTPGTWALARRARGSGRSSVPTRLDGRARGAGQQRGTDAEPFCARWRSGGERRATGSGVERRFAAATSGPGPTPCRARRCQVELPAGFTSRVGSTAAGTPVGDPPFPTAGRHESGRRAAGIDVASSEVGAPGGGEPPFASIAAAPSSMPMRSAPARLQLRRRLARGAGGRGSPAGRRWNVWKRLHPLGCPGRAAEVCLAPSRTLRRAPPSTPWDVAYGRSIHGLGDASRRSVVRQTPPPLAQARRRRWSTVEALRWIPVPYRTR